VEALFKLTCTNFDWVGSEKDEDRDVVPQVAKVTDHFTDAATPGFGTTALCSIGPRCNIYSIRTLRVAFNSVDTRA
jgi:hypothetical protein